MKWLRYYLEYCPSSPPPSFLTALSLSIWSQLARGRQGSKALLYWSHIDQQGQRCPCESTRLIEDIKPLPRQTDIAVKYSPSFPEDVWSCFFIYFSLSVLSPLSFFSTFTSFSHSLSLHSVVVSDGIGACLPLSIIVFSSPPLPECLAPGPQNVVPVCRVMEAGLDPSQPEMASFFFCAASFQTRYSNYSTVTASWIILFL